MRLILNDKHVDKVTGRLRSLRLEAQTSSEELFLTHLAERAGQLVSITFRDVSGKEGSHSFVPVNRD